MVQDTVYRCIPPCLTWKGPTSSDLCLRLVQDLAFIDDDCTSTYMNGKLSILHCEHYTALQGAKRSGGLYKVHKVSQGFRRFADVVCSGVLGGCLCCHSICERFHCSTLARVGLYLLSFIIDEKTCAGTASTARCTPTHSLTRLSWQIRHPISGTSPECPASSSLRICGLCSLKSDTKSLI